MSYSVSQWLLFFYIYCFIGWVWETSYVSVRQHRFVNRGFMRGPFLPIYGSGVIVMLFVSIPFRNSLILTYISGLIGATILEYFTGEAMEAIFKVRYWDYSYQKFNFRGHICLKSSLFWGLATIGVTRYLHKPIERLVLSINPTALSIITIILTVIISADFALSFKAAIDLRNLLIKMEENAKRELENIKKRADVMIAIADSDLTEAKEKLDNAKEAIIDKFDDAVDALADKIDDLDDAKDMYLRRMEIRKAFLQDSLSAFQRNMLKSNPMMVSPKFRVALEEIKADLKIRDYIAEKYTKKGEKNDR